MNFMVIRFLHLFKSCCLICRTRVRRNKSIIVVLQPVKIYYVTTKGYRSFPIVFQINCFLDRLATFLYQYPKIPHEEKTHL